MKKNIAFICFTIIFIITASCNDVYTLCNLPKDVRFIAGFYQRISNTDVSVQAPGVTVFLLNGSSPIYNKQKNLSSFSLPLNPLVDSSQYVITVADNLPQDTLTIVYSSQTSLLSPECGSIILNNISRVSSTLHTIDSVKITTPAVNTAPIENVRIFY